MPNFGERKDATAMKRFSRFLSALLCIAVLCSALPPAWAAPAGAASGSISLTLRLDYDQPIAQLQSRQVQVKLYQGQLLLGSLPLYQKADTTLSGCPAQVSVRAGYLDLSVSGLPLGSYILELTGLGYRTVRQSVTLGSFSQHVTLGTGDATFTLGDVNGDGWVNQLDRDAMSAVLGSTAPQDLRVYDLNGDGAIDIVDLSWLSRGITAAGTAGVRDTVMLAPPVDSSASSRELEQAGVSVTGSLDDLFAQNGRSVGFTASGEDNVSIPLSFSSPTEMEEVVITSPADDTGVRKGRLVVEAGDGTLYEIPFDSAQPQSRAAGSNVISVPLGRRVAVKKITIVVEKTGKNQYAVLETVEFLRDIVPENPVMPNSEIKGLAVTEGSEQVSLRWNALPNISGYQVEYWLRDSAGAQKKTLQVNVPSATVTGLINLKTYLFTVTPMDGAWMGKPSSPVAGTPQPARAPSAPDMVNVSALESSLVVSWKASENATYYKLYYTTQANAGPSAYQQYGSQTTGTRMTLHNLTNGTPCYIYIVAGNRVGESGPSRIATGTPTAVDYERPAGIPTEGVLEYDSFEKVWLTDRSNVANSYYTPEKPFQESNMADGDFSTHWTSQAWGEGSFARSKQVNCTFKTPQDLSGVIWVSRLDGTFSNNLRSYTVTVWTEGEDLNGPGTVIAPSSGQTSNTRTWPAVNNMGKFALLPFSPARNVKKIAVTVEQRDYLPVSLAELMFLSYNPSHDLAERVADLFADASCTTLKPGVTLAQINGLRDRLNSDEGKYYMDVDILTDELRLAEELLNAGRSSGVVLNRLCSLNGKNPYKQGGSVLQPLGAAAQAQADPSHNAESKIVVYASGIPAGESVALYASQHNAEASAWSAKMGELQNGRNVLTVPKIGSENTPRGGSLYYTYGGTHGEQIKLHVRMAVDIPALELSDWYALSETQRREKISAYLTELNAFSQGVDCLNVTEIATPSVLLSLPAASVKSATVDSLYNSILAWEDVMHICLTTQGIDKTYGSSDMNLRQNIRCMQMFSGAFMYAAGNHIGIGTGSCAGMAAGKPIDNGNQLFGWGIAHEIGHNMDKLGKAEITNNIYALMVQTWDGAQNTGASRLEASNKYPAIFTKTAQGYPGASNDVFVQLGMYWQLHLAYDGGANPNDFYNRFFKDWKAGTYFAGQTSYDDRVALTASAVANKDLTEFFTRWGMTLSDATKKKLETYEDETRAIWYLSDQSRRDRLNNTGTASGTFTASVDPEKDKEVKITIDNSKLTGSIQGYEILRNGKSIAFTKEPVYTDVVGTANHRNYEYSVNAYDLLGNKIGETVSAGEVRIAYDDVVPEEQYTVESKNGAWTFTLKEKTSVSGIKITGTIPEAGEFAVKVNGETARTGNFIENQAVDDKSSFVSYLNHPGTTQPDSRIWTYDAETVEVTNVPEGARVQLIRYAGDDVAFWTDAEGSFAAIGTLEKAYDEIPAGSLVIVGTYRGTPVFNGIRAVGRFTVTEDDGETKAVEERPLNGELYLFAEDYGNAEVSTVADGIFVFVLDEKAEAELQKPAQDGQSQSNCSGVNLLPSQVKMEIYQCDVPGKTDKQHKTAETPWVNSPGGDVLPVIVLEGGAK